MKASFDKVPPEHKLVRSEVSFKDIWKKEFWVWETASAKVLVWKKAGHGGRNLEEVFVMGVESRGEQVGGAGETMTGCVGHVEAQPVVTGRRPASIPLR